MSIVDMTTNKILTDATLKIEREILHATKSGLHAAEAMVGFRAHVFSTGHMVIQFILLPDIGRVGVMPLCGFTMHGWVVQHMWITTEVEVNASMAVLHVLAKGMYETAMQLAQADGIDLVTDDLDIYLMWVLTDFDVTFDQTVDGEPFAFIEEK